MIERAPIRFARWKPVRLDHGVAYSFTNPADGRRVQRGSDRWMRVRLYVAASAIATGAEEYTATGGTGTRRWRRTVLITQQEADAYFTEALARPTGFMVAGLYRQVCTQRERRLRAGAPAKSVRVRPLSP